MSFIRKATPVMIAIGGLSGSGKSTLAEEMGKRMPGAIVLDSDVFRKSLHGVDPKTPLPDDAYTPEKTKDFIRRIRKQAKQYLKAGKSVIVTGTFLDKTTRMEQEELARGAGADFIGIYIHAAASTLFTRVSQRKDSASDADKRILKKQIKALQAEQAREAAGRGATPPKPFREINWQIINGDQPLDAMLHSAVLYIHQEMQRMRYSFGPAPAKARKVKKATQPKP